MSVGISSGFWGAYLELIDLAAKYLCILHVRHVHHARFEN
jgi:hypothetical protein